MILSEYYFLSNEKFFGKQPLHTFSFVWKVVKFFLIRTVLVVLQGGMNNSSLMFLFLCANNIIQCKKMHKFFLLNFINLCKKSFHNKNENCNITSKGPALDILATLLQSQKVLINISQNR